MSEEIRKSFSGGPIKADAAADIDLINRHTIRTLSPDEVRCFSVVMCDNDIDRETERFTDKTLETLASLFVGKTVISDHRWESGNQIGRIYSCEVRTTQKRNKAGGVLKQLMGKFYILNNESNKAKIDALEGGILKEVSVNVSIKSRTCSLCGEKMHLNWTSYQLECKNHHILGETYPDGGLCYLNLDDPKDAYELSFVAVPAQPEAGVTKGRGNHSGLSLEEWARRKQIVEESNGVTIPDAAWEAVILGKATSAEVITALRKQKEADAAKPKHYPDIIPSDNDCYDDIRYALIPSDVIPKDVMVDVWKALGFCRKELCSPPISVKWFSPIAFVRRLGLDASTIKTFKGQKELMGIASRQNPTQILLKYPLENGDFRADRMKTVFHECWHTMQFRDDWNPAEEASAYAYMEDAYKRYCALSASEKEDLYMGELLMKDYSK